MTTPQPVPPLPDRQQLLATARVGVAFSNGTEWDLWSECWCQRCTRDLKSNCPLILFAITEDRTPDEWQVPQGARPDRHPHAYECSLFVPRQEI